MGNGVVWGYYWYPFTPTDLSHGTPSSPTAAPDIDAMSLHMWDGELRLPPLGSKRGRKCYNRGDNLLSTHLNGGNRFNERKGDDKQNYGNS